VREQRSWHDELRSALLGMHGLESQSAVPEELQPQWQRYVEMAKTNRRHLDVRPWPLGDKAGVGA
jgi:hypothetical protein